VALLLYVRVSARLVILGVRTKLVREAVIAVSKGKAYTANSKLIQPGIVIQRSLNEERLSF